MQKTIQQQLFELQDLKYRDFHAKLVPGMDVNAIIGVRTPELRKLAKQLAKDERIGEFLAVLPHRYLDEMNLHGFIISELKDYDECLKEIERFLPYVNNWATCDLLSPKAFKQKKNRLRLLGDIKRWMASDEPFIIRFGIETLMSFYLGEDFKEEHIERVYSKKDQKALNKTVFKAVLLRLGALSHLGNPDSGLLRVGIDQAQLFLLETIHTSSFKDSNKCSTKTCTENNAGHMLSTVYAVQTGLILVVK